MAGTVLENLSSRKLFALGGVLLVVQIVFFMIGGLIAPSPTSPIRYIASKCVDRGHHKSKWFVPWGPKDQVCEKVQDFDEATRKHIGANDIVFAAHIPLPNREMVRWFQFLLMIMELDVAFKVDNPVAENAVVTMEAGLAYRDDRLSEWTPVARSTEERKLVCNFSHSKTADNEGRYYDCDMVPLFELGSCFHKYYLINIRLPVREKQNINLNIGDIKDVNLIGIHQNGGFTKVWLSVKTTLTPTIIIILVWYWRRVTQLNRKPVLLEKTIFALGLSMAFINLPLELITIAVDVPWMLLLSDIRQGIFYCMLLSFWIIFTGEHLMDQSERNRLSVYWRQVGAITFGCLCMFIFDMCERGVQLTNPFYSIWVTETGKNLALAFIILAGVCASIYFFFLCFMVFKVFRNISGKRASLPTMSDVRRLHYEGLIYRFKFLMLFTLLCAATTVIFFIISQVNEGHWKWGEEHTVEINSAFLTGVYGMWNVYVFSVICLYAPSHKRKGLEGQQSSNIQLERETSEDGSNEEIELRLTNSQASGDAGELSVIYKIAGKEAQE
ncbi:protein wntless homolog [Branchiostoma lanceolatum]|uniref:protein wntless homolog n=1 Tax=Branchiostoma lanceolatum TaxID=7740 RepID=UPI0034559132